MSHDIYYFNRSMFIQMESALKNTINLKKKTIFTRNPYCFFSLKQTRQIYAKVSFKLRPFIAKITWIREKIYLNNNLIFRLL